MARKISKSEYEAEIKKVKSKADNLAQQYGLNVERVFNVLLRIARNSRFGPLWDETLRSEAAGIIIFVDYPSLEDALCVLPKEEALSLFEKENLHIQAKRILETGWLLNELSPLYTLDELGSLIEEFLDHQESSRDYLIKLGYPQTTFVKSKWIDGQLNKLYGIEPPPGQKIGEIEPIQGLSLEETSRIELLREKMFRFKILVLQELKYAFRQNDASDLWKKILCLLTESFTASEVDFLLKVDHLVQPHAAINGSTFGKTSGSGGLTNILSFYGYVEKELSIGTLAETKEAFQMFIPKKILDSHQFTAKDYFNIIIKDGNLDVLINALKNYELLFEREPSFITDFHDRINKALKEELYEDVHIRVKVKRRVAQKFESNLLAYSNFIKSSVEMSGAFPQMACSAPDEPTNAYVFRKKGDYWELVHEGKPASFKDSIGIKYIACLLSHPKRSFPVLELVSLARGVVTSNSAKYYKNMPKEELEKERLDGTGGVGYEYLYDKQALKEFREQINELDEDIQEAKDNLDYEKAAKLEEEKQDLLDWLKKDYGIGGRSRKFDSNVEKARKSVANAITRAIENIREDLPRLATHLDNSIQRGTLLTYIPDKDLPWNL